MAGSIKRNYKSKKRFWQLLNQALILKKDQDELVKYLDVPAFHVGDLYYIQNLITVIEADESFKLHTLRMLLLRSVRNLF